MTPTNAIAKPHVVNMLKDGFETFQIVKYLWDCWHIGEKDALEIIAEVEKESKSLSTLR